ncbi:MAG: chemotaxis protein CheW [Arcobacteraceae bacterium]|jgi:two-component system chemotaxis response regulator CheV|nr:chemotaxis protein CheW [Arcobacteraceae bacterium]
MSGISNSVEQLTRAHLRNVQQLAVFYTGKGNIYAINIAKIKAFIITEEVSISDTPSDSDIIQGIATIRGVPITLVNLDRWLGHPALPIEQYKLIIFCEFNNHQIGFLVKDVINIVEKTTAELINNEEQNSKVTYTTYVEVNKQTKLCTVFNAEQLLVDIGWTDDGQSQLDKYIDKPVNNKKVILAAEDSRVAREILIAFFKKIEAQYEIFNNGTDLVERLKHIDPEHVGCVITDIEMPGTDGFQVAQFIKGTSDLAHIPIIVNSSMTTTAIKNKMISIGVDDFVGKTDIQSLYKSVLEYLGSK